MSGPPWPVEIVVRRGAKTLTARFDDGAAFELPARLLRAMTPSAEAHGHGGPSFQPVAAKIGVGLTDATPVGRYAVRLHFDDGHASGLYTWERLHRIGREAARLTAEMNALDAGA